MSALFSWCQRVPLFIIKKEEMDREVDGHTPPRTLRRYKTAQVTLSFHSILISKQRKILLRMATNDLRDCPSALTT